MNRLKAGTGQSCFKISEMQLLESNPVEGLIIDRTIEESADLDMIVPRCQDRDAKIEMPRCHGFMTPN